MPANTEAPEIPGGRGGTIRPWQPGQSGNPQGMDASRREAHRLARLASPDAVQTLIGRMNDPAEDSRVRIVAATALLDRGLGKPKDGPSEAETRDDVDLSHLTDAEVQELHVALKTVERLTGRGLAPVPMVQIYLPENGRDVPKGGMLYTDPDRIMTVRHVIVDPKAPDTGC